MAHRICLTFLFHSWHEHVSMIYLCKKLSTIEKTYDTKYHKHWPEVARVTHTKWKCCPNLSSLIMVLNFLRGHIILTDSWYMCNEKFYQMVFRSYNASFYYPYGGYFQVLPILICVSSWWYWFSFVMEDVGMILN